MKRRRFLSACAIGLLPVGPLFADAYLDPGANSLRPDDNAAHWFMPEPNIRSDARVLITLVSCDGAGQAVYRGLAILVT